MTLSISDLRKVALVDADGIPGFYYDPVSFDDLASLEGAEKLWWCEQHADIQYGDKTHYCQTNWDGGASAPCQMVERVLLPPVKEEE